MTRPGDGPYYCAVMIRTLPVPPPAPVGPVAPEVPAASVLPAPAASVLPAPAARHWLSVFPAVHSRPA